MLKIVIGDTKKKINAYQRENHQSIIRKFLVLDNLNYRVLKIYGPKQGIYNNEDSYIRFRQTWGLMHGLGNILKS